MKQFKSKFANAALNVAAVGFFGAVTAPVLVLVVVIAVGLVGGVAFVGLHIYHAVSFVSVSEPPDQPPSDETMRAVAVGEEISKVLESNRSALHVRAEWQEWGKKISRNVTFAYDVEPLDRPREQSNPERTRLLKTKLRSVVNGHGFDDINDWERHFLRTLARYRKALGFRGRWKTYPGEMPIGPIDQLGEFRIVPAKKRLDSAARPKSTPSQQSDGARERTTQPANSEPLGGPRTRIGGKIRRAAISESSARVELIGRLQAIFSMP